MIIDVVAIVTVLSLFSYLLTLSLSCILGNSSNMIASRITYQIIFLTSFGVALTCALIVLAYLKSKPTGMQTLFDLIIKDLIIIATTYRVIVVVAIFLICNVAPLNYWIARGLTGLIYLLFLLLFIDIFIVIVVRYIIIYYNVLIADISDTKLLCISRITIFVSSMIFWSFHIIGFSSSGKSFFTALSQIEGKFGTPNQSLGIIVCVDVIALILTQIKIEKDKPNDNNNSVMLHNQNDSTNFSFSAIRGVTIVVLVYCLIVLAAIIKPYVITTTNNTTDRFLYVTLIMDIFVGNICPAMFISRNPKIVEFVKSRYLCNF
jgi:hypothetical protein